MLLDFFTGLLEEETALEVRLFFLCFPFFGVPDGAVCALEEKTP